jgi:hypothetical protein
MFEQGNAEADKVTETLDNAVSEILDASFVAAPKDTPPVISDDDDDVAIVEVPHKNTTNKLYHKNTESWEEQINTVSVKSWNVTTSSKLQNPNVLLGARRRLESFWK